jgi:hypothetical protein
VGLIQFLPTFRSCFTNTSHLSVPRSTDWFIHELFKHFSERGWPSSLRIVFLSLQVNYGIIFTTVSRNILTNSSFIHTQYIILVVDIGTRFNVYGSCLIFGKCVVGIQGGAVTTGPRPTAVSSPSWSAGEILMFHPCVWLKSGYGSLVCLC